MDLIIVYNDRIVSRVHAAINKADDGTYVVIGKRDRSV
jgi:pSer/pThr/pTyr-binding forkhead associated (FHA) protein